jgi:hypothetical protein
MSDKVTKKMLSLFTKEAGTPMFLASFFRSPPENFYNSETVEIDIERSDEEVAIPVQDLSAGWRSNSYDLYTNKNFLPPILKESFPINAFDQINRVAGDHPFQSPNYVANALRKFVSSTRKIAGKIRRTIEWQAAQILQTGTVSLVDSSGNVVYTINYLPKANHFFTVANAWNGASATIVEDHLTLANRIRDDSLGDPTDCLYGEQAFEDAMQNDDFRERFNTRRVNLGEIELMRPGITGGTNGGNFRGIINVGNYPLRCWTYGGRYKHPSTGDKNQFIATDKMIMLSIGARLDATFGNIPSIVRPDQRVMPYLNRVRGVRRGIDLIPHAWVTDDGEQIFGGLNSRPLLIPTDIDSFGAIDTRP